MNHTLKRAAGAVAGLLLGVLAAEAVAEEAIVTGAAARVRAQPAATAPEVSRLPLGATVEAFEQSGQGADAWRRVTAGSGSGWVAARFLAPFDPAKRDQAYLALARKRLALEPSFGDDVELTQFLERVAPHAADREAKAELSLAALQALHRSLGKIPLDGHSPAQDAWLKTQEERAVYSEPAGEWYVRADALWDLEQTYRDTRLGERIAWDAAQIPLPGECEGYLPCYLGFMTLSVGEYLRRYPKGAHAPQALATLIETFVTSTTEAPRLQEMGGDDGRKDLANGIKEIRQILTRVPGSQKALSTLAALEKAHTRR